ncbi:hypothetical protein VTO58DRAFT_108403 [Aureobasidium pullulans]
MSHNQVPNVNQQAQQDAVAAIARVHDSASSASGPLTAFARQSYALDTIEEVRTHR